MRNLTSIESLLVHYLATQAYNRVNNIHVSEDKFLLDDVLRKEWGWDGIIVSDWNGTYSTVEAIKAGMYVFFLPVPSLRFLR